MDYKNRIYNYAEFIYQPSINMTPLEIDNWIKKIKNDILTNEKYKNVIFERVLYWKIITTRNTTIKRDDKWFYDNLETFRQMWEYVKYFRINKDKATLLKRYIETFPLDYYKKIKEPLKNKGIIMKTIQKMYNETDINYKIFMNNLEKEIEESEK